MSVESNLHGAQLLALEVTVRINNAIMALSISNKE